MDKKQYEKKWYKLLTDIKKLKKEYIRTNSPFKNGTRVKITTPMPSGEPMVEFGVVNGYEICGDNRVRPMVKKIKNDGTVSQFLLGLRYNSKVEPV